MTKWKWKVFLALPTKEWTEARRGIFNKIFKVPGIGCEGQKLGDDVRFTTVVVQKHTKKALLEELDIIPNCVYFVITNTAFDGQFDGKLVESNTEVTGFEDTPFTLQDAINIWQTK